MLHHFWMPSPVGDLGHGLSDLGLEAVCDSLVMGVILCLLQIIISIIEKFKECPKNIGFFFFFFLLRERESSTYGVYS